MTGLTTLEQSESVASGVNLLSAPVRVAGDAVRVVRGRKAVLAAQPLLLEFATRCGEPAAADNLAYFLSIAASLKKTPYLVLVHCDSEACASKKRGIAIDGLCGAVLLFEYRLWGCGLQIFAPEDMTGRRCVIAPPEERAFVAARASHALLERGAQIVFAAFQHERRDAATVPALEATLSALAASPGDAANLWSARELETHMYLALAPTFDETLNTLSQKTRYNYRYYRRRAERDLGCTFVPEAKLTLEELLAFNRVSRFSVAADLAAWRHRILPSVRGGFLCGVRDRDGQWLALVCGRRNGKAVEIDWQSNRVDLPGQSLSVVARSYVVEWAIDQRCTRLYMEGGTDHPIRRSFVPAAVTEFTTMRGTLYARLVRKLAPRITPAWNRLAQIVSDPAVTWRSW